MNEKWVGDMELGLLSCESGQAGVEAWGLRQAEEKKLRQKCSQKQAGKGESQLA